MQLRLSAIGGRKMISKDGVEKNDFILEILKLEKKKQNPASAARKMSLSEQKYCARRIAKAAKSIWSYADHAEFSEIRNLSEMLFYEAYVTARRTTEGETTSKQQIT
jgi:hypothetical protein